jgi:hypothetical protein
MRPASAAITPIALHSRAATAPLIAESRKTCVDEVVRTRDYLAHFTDELKRRAATPGRRLALTVALSNVVRDCLLGEMGSPPDIRKALFEGSQGYLFAVHEGMKEWSKTQER